MLLLALDTSGAGVTVALHDGSRVLAERSAHQPRRHAETLAPCIAATVDAARARLADVSEIAVGVGPGPFTGLRVGLVTARVLGLTLGVAVHGVCSLDAIAQAAVDGGRVAEGPFLVATDARRREVYWAEYRSEAGQAVRESGPDVAAPAAVPRAGRPVVGRGAELYPEHLGPVETAEPVELVEPVESLDPVDVTGAAVARLAVRRLSELSSGSSGSSGGLPLPGPDPMYLRRPDATEPGPRKRVLS